MGRRCIVLTLTACVCCPQPPPVFPCMSAVSRFVIRIPALPTETYFHPAGTTTWGGQAIRDPLDPSLYHIFYARMVNQCGLDCWVQNSECARATGPNPWGPFTFQVRPTQQQLPVCMHALGADFIDWPWWYCRSRLGDLRV
jgi:hypothetical protein